ncbi:MAG: acyl-[Lachnospiraceae bacterium]|nr:acyl-[acyl-carrier-protein] thioesterase [Lachnospiraceae bacterium]
MVFEMDEIVRYSQTDGQLRLTVPALLDFFQDAATFQAEEAGVGVDVLNAHGLGWFLVSWNVEINRLPRHAEKIVVGTFPYRFNSRFGNRNCYIKTPDGEYLAKADSIWAMMDKKQGRIVPIPDFVGKAYTVEDPLPMEYAGRKIALPEAMEDGEPIPVISEHIDFHGHVNNSKYLAMVTDFMPKGELSGFRVEYKGQTRRGDILVPRFATEGNRTFVSLCVGEEARTNIEFTTK